MTKRTDFLAGVAFCALLIPTGLTSALAGIVPADKTVFENGAGSGVLRVQAECREGETAEACEARSLLDKEPQEPTADQPAAATANPDGTPGEAVAPAEAETMTEPAPEPTAGQPVEAEATETPPAEIDPAPMTEGTGTAGKDAATEDEPVAETANPDGSPAEATAPAESNAAAESADPDGTPKEETAPAEAEAAETPPAETELAPMTEGTGTAGKDAATEDEPIAETANPDGSPAEATAPAESNAAAENANPDGTPKEEPAPTATGEAANESEPDAFTEQPAAAETADPSGTSPAENANDGEVAPLFDSQKENPAAENAGAPAPAAPPPANDAEAQADVKTEVESAKAEEGQRVDRPRRKRRSEDDSDILREFGSRLVIQFGNNIYVERRDEEDRVWRDASDVYYEELPRGRVREVVVRPNGVQVITIRNRYGDVLHRSKIFPDGREVVLVHVARDYYDHLDDWSDPGNDLPPIRLTIPRQDYILEAETVDDPVSYYTFLSQPPVERVERTYSLTDVKRSARIRDKVRRIDLDTINFDFGSAQISENQIPALEGLARGIERLLEKNPAESFLVEGHTDAVGSDLANLALSDERAEAVVNALTRVFGIPPENLIPQGYGEQYLKVRTQERNRENRRVAIRRITPLVAPVAAAE